ncbi:hypothetical protein Tco_0350187, partial [Tanacetum coccineum]
DSFLMAGLPTDRAALDEYMAVWFRCEVVQLRSTAVMFRKEVEEMVESRRLVVEHLEKVRGCPTSGWLDRLRVNHEEDLELFNLVVARLYAVVRKREEDVSDIDY